MNKKVRTHISAISV